MYVYRCCLLDCILRSDPSQRPTHVTNSNVDLLFILGVAVQTSSKLFGK